MFKVEGMIIHDQMENVQLKTLKRIFDYCGENDIQYILPILHDRIDTLEIDESCIKLRLSKTDKLFKF